MISRKLIVSCQCAEYSSWGGVVIGRRAARSSSRPCRQGVAPARQRGARPAPACWRPPRRRDRQDARHRCRRCAGSATSAAPALLRKTRRRSISLHGGGKIEGVSAERAGAGEAGSSVKSSSPRSAGSAAASWRARRMRQGRSWHGVARRVGSGNVTSGGGAVESPPAAGRSPFRMAEATASKTDVPPVP